MAICDERPPCIEQIHYIHAHISLHYNQKLVDIVKGEEVSLVPTPSHSVKGEEVSLAPIPLHSVKGEEVSLAPTPLHSVKGEELSLAPTPSTQCKRCGSEFGPHRIYTCKSSPISLLFYYYNT